VNVFNRWARIATALAAAAVALPATAGAAPVRTATATTYTDATFLQHALGLPAADTDPAIESVTYDRFQWLLQQSGNLAFLIGDPATDATFAARAQDVEAAAKDAGAKKVYWFDPNLSGSAKVGSVTEPALDIRKPSSVPLAAASQTKYGNAWLNVVGQYLGNGYTVTANGLNGENATVTATHVATAINDYGSTATYSTKVGDTSGGALYDYSSATPANVQDSFFLIYNKAHTVADAKAAKVVSWTDLTTQAGSSSTKADVTTAIGTVGAANLTRLDQFAWWKDEVDTKQVTQGGSAAEGANVPVLTDADNAAADGGWRVDQVTYPELVDLLKNDNDANAVILFGGTWCPNTRPVIGSVNKYAQQNNVHVFNFDTVLDGGVVGGSTTGASDPLQSRNSTNNSTTANANPTSLYGDVLSQYLTNINTEYKLTSTSVVTYYPGGDTTGTVTSAKKLQVPFVIGYQGKPGDAPNGGVTRQWIIDKGDGTYKEYMSEWEYTNPQPNELGLALPLAAPIWSTVNSQVANFTWQTDPATVYANTGVDTDDAQYLVDTDKANVTYNSAGNGSVSVSSSASGSVGIGPAALSDALSALGGAAPANYAAARTAYVAAQKAASPDPALIARLTTVVGAWGVAQSRKNTLNTAWGNATTPGSVVGGIAAVHALDVFFGGLPGGVLSRRTVTANPVTAGTAPTISLTIANDYGRVPTGTVSLVVKQGAATVATASTAVAQNAASFTLPALGAGTYDYTLSYPGDDQIAAFTDTGSLTVSPAADSPVVVPISTPVATPTPSAKVSKVKASKLKGAVAKAPTSRKAGRYKVTITTPKGASAASGKVTIKLKKGKITKTITGRLSHGVVTVSLPKLARGTWKVTISWPGDTHYLTASAAGASIKVSK
jgi:hypothetical protein